MKLLSRSLLFIFIVSCLVTCSFNPYENQQVLTIAPDVIAPLLKVKKHIRNTPRPEDPISYPIKLGEVGPVQPLFSGNLHYPFSCHVQSSGLGQPLIDNQELLGTPVFALDENGKKTHKVIGFSKDCLIVSQLRYFKVDIKDNISEVFIPFDLKSTDLLLRIEQGTINRYIYAIVMPVERNELKNRLLHSKWNKRLIYQFAGGVGIGFRQGKLNPMKLISRRTPQLRKGYAVITSTANKTSFSYNMLQAEDTALRVKRQFISLYGKPLYTLGVGGSGGGLAQYILAQNSSELLDGALPLYSYPDMISQTLYALDCDLLNSYYTFKSSLESWDSPEKKQAIEGFNNSNIEHKSWFYYPFNQLARAKKVYIPKNYSECIHGYFGLSSLINNPDQGFIKKIFSPEVKQKAHWSYWQDLTNILGIDNNGFANSVWDNQGVQYGLTALQQGTISPKEFIHLNYHIGGWKPQQEMRQEQLLFLPFTKIPIWMTQWSTHNIYPADKGPAKRTKASTKAIENAYRYGQIFIGFNDVPTIDIHHYLEPELDMHHISTSFATRLRILSQAKNLNNHKIWIAHPDHTPLEQAFLAMDEWLLKGNSKQLKMKTSDRCFDKNGKVIAQGDQVWNGSWNKKQLGTCAQTYPIYTNSRIQAGGPWQGSIFKCQMMSVKKAMSSGLYGNIDMTVYQNELEQIFPDGVCDYNFTDTAKPLDLTLN
ncbi:DUF6351 family protein [Pseudoalteromonas denitrificans]|uniref:DUF6351 domain-containing protein n=1 Tax=Pseudoalteromonas denitrificans DSM 6059 TaxID=1123010 RepID=A0A1I1PMD9_9GAMM|nr:DUF6351 family protein [Pseudoalteromonas denitrificans]SFD11049.1 hypothetical protein SAMN02745724_03514 [Pseudoalteromonas denitrificans DSM 6059]